MLDLWELYVLCVVVKLWFLFLDVNVYLLIFLMKWYVIEEKNRLEMYIFNIFMELVNKISIIYLMIDLYLLRELFVEIEKFI